MNPSISTEAYSDIQLLSAELKRFGLSLKPDEAQKIYHRLGRAPSLAELFIFDIEWSEHCSYKSSKSLLKKYLPVSGKNVIQGPEEDAGIIYFTTHENHRYGIVIAHESHNHPSQVLPFEGAATGIGGIVRDVDCMGASVIGVADPLRFGNPNGHYAERTKSIVEGVVEGIWHYGNALGVPNLGGDAVFHDGFDDNCLVNVVALGLLKEQDIIHSRVPECGEGYDLILVGKPTDRSGFGGASFASGTLDSENKEENKGAVQIPDPFLKNILLHYKATHEVRRRARELGISIGMKDLGAGGIACCSSELGESGGFGVEINLDNVHVAEENLPPEIILCAETQERYLLAVPPEFTPEVLKIYNEDWTLPSICFGAGAHVIGKAIREQVMRVTHHGQIVTELPIDFVVEGIRYNRASEPRISSFTEPVFDIPVNLNEIFMKMLAQPNIASKEWIFRHYDTEVQGNAVIRPGEADASLIVPLESSSSGIALSVDGNPFYGEISPFWGGATAVAESMRNVAAIGAVPRAMTDCLNFGNPEVPQDFWALEEGIKGLSEAATQLHSSDDPEPIPFVSGNVSLYNQSASGRSVPPSPIIACVGVIEDASKAITMDVKQSDSRLILVGERFDELGGSEYYRTIGESKGANVPIVRYALERGIIYGTIEAISKSLVLSAHDISNGGLLTAAAEMLLAMHPCQTLGLEIYLNRLSSDLREDTLLFSESSGMLLEVKSENLDTLKKEYQSYSMDVCEIGITTPNNRLAVFDHADNPILDLSIPVMRECWRGAFGLTLAT